MVMKTLRDTTSTRIARFLGLALLATVAAVAVEVPAVDAQAACAPRADRVRWLAERHNEKQIAIGLSAGGEMIEVYASPERLTWTIVATRPDGATWIVVTGRSWQSTAKAEGLEAGLGSH
jgi:hypothetical protein